MKIETKQTHTPTEALVACVEYALAKAGAMYCDINFVMQAVRNHDYLVEKIQLATAYLEEGAPNTALSQLNGALNVISKAHAMIKEGERKC